MDNRPSLSGKRNYRGLEIETKTSPSGRGRTFFLTSLFIELIDLGRDCGIASFYDRAATESNKFRNCNFFSASKKDASNEFLASSRKCSSVKPNASWAS
jgi:hypothetical protein